jgi:hypothetical protein
MERIATSPEPVVVPEWHHEVISERLREIESDPNSGDKWESCRRVIRGLRTCPKPIVLVYDVRAGSSAPSSLVQ